MMSGEPAVPVGPARTEPRAQTPPRFLELGGGTLAYTAAGWLDLFAGADGNALTALCTGALLAGGTLLLLRAVSRRLERPAAPAARRIMLAALAFSALLTLAIAVNLAAHAEDPSIYDADAAAFNQYNAALVLHGQNPYTADATFWDALSQFPSVGATPLRAGRYAGSVFGPSLARVVADTQYERAHPQARGPEYASSSLHSYPALAFLVYVPGVWVGQPTTFYTSLLFLLAFFLAAGWAAPRAVRPGVWLLLLASSLLVFWTLRGSFEVVALLPALLAWRLVDRRWLSPLLLGLACAVKQLVWPLVPLYSIIIWKREGPRAAVTRLAVTLVGFLAPNLPFILLSPGAWARSMLLPVTLPIFPSGIGLVGLARGGVLPLLPPAAYALLELAALGVLAFWLARTRRRCAPEVALLLGLLPFALSWHSLFTYLMSIPVLAVACVLPQCRSAAHQILPVEPVAVLAVENPVGAGPAAGLQ
jgi:hypothetical protein